KDLPPTRGEYPIYRGRGVSERPRIPSLVDHPSNRPRDVVPPRQGLDLHDKQYLGRCFACPRLICLSLSGSNLAALSTDRENLLNFLISTLYFLNRAPLPRVSP